MEPSIVKPKHCFVLKTFPNGGEEVYDAISQRRKITYSSGDVVFFQEGASGSATKVIAISPHDWSGRMMRYSDEDISFLSSVRFDKGTREAQEYRLKQKVAAELAKDEKAYEVPLLALFKAWGVEVSQAGKAVAMKFFGMKEEKQQ